MKSLQAENPVVPRLHPLAAPAGPLFGKEGHEEESPVEPDPEDEGIDLRAYADSIIEDVFCQSQEEANEVPEQSESNVQSQLHQFVKAQRTQLLTDMNLSVCSKSCEDSGETTKAISFYEQCLDQNVDDFEASLCLANLLMEQGHGKRASPYY